MKFTSKLTLCLNSIIPIVATPIVVNSCSFFDKDTTPETVVPENPDPSLPEDNNKDLDKLPNKLLSTPSGAYSWKGELPKLVIKTTENSVARDIYYNKIKYGWKDAAKELAYHARFILWQSFVDNFSEINYYTYNKNNNPDQITAVAEGIVKNDVENHKFSIQITDTTYFYKTNLKKGDKIKIEFQCTKPTNMFGLIDFLPVTFEQRTKEWGENPIWRHKKYQYGTTLNNYSTIISKNDSEIIYQDPRGNPRIFSFVLGLFNKVPVI